MRGEVYLIDDERGWFVVHESRHGDSSGIDGPFASRLGAIAAGRDLADRLCARFIEGEVGQVLTFSSAGDDGRAPA